MGQMPSRSSLLRSPVLIFEALHSPRFPTPSLLPLTHNLSSTPSSSQIPLRDSPRLVNNVRASMNTRAERRLHLQYRHVLVSSPGILRSTSPSEYDRRHNDHNAEGLQRVWASGGYEFGRGPRGAAQFSSPSNSCSASLQARTCVCSQMSPGAGGFRGGGAPTLLSLTNSSTAGPRLSSGPSGSSSRHVPTNNSHSHAPSWPLSTQATPQT